MKHAKYPHVFLPLAIGPITVRNRIFVPAHTTSYGDNNLPTDRHLAYHQARAAGGAGLIIFEAIRVHRSSLGRKQGVNGYERACIPRFRRIGDAVRNEGGKLFGQIIHLGRHIDGNYTRTPSWGASPIAWTATAPAPHPMTISEIKQVVDAHATTAANLVEAGLDGIEVQMAHGHLLQQFMSPASNHRSDEYGGTLANRLRFAQETLAAVRAAIGHEVALGIRISADEFLPDGLGVDDMCEIVPLLLQETAVDFVNVSHSAYHGSYTIATQMADMSFPFGTFLPLTTRINRALSELPVKPLVMTACGYRSVENAETVLAAKHADMIGMARAHIADPAIVNKALLGHEESTIPCIGCNQGCAGMLEKGLAITCLSNPRAGLEQQWSSLEDLPVRTGRRVLVVGGGPGGSEAAATAAAMGHSVTLWEQSDRLGGELNWTEVMPLRAEFQPLLRSLKHRLSEHKVEVHLNRLATAGAIQALAPDSLILATGAIAKHESFSDGGSGLTLQQALHDVDALGQHVVLQDVTGSWAVASTVEHLVDLGKSVTVVVPGGAPAWMINIYSLFALRRRWVEKHIRIIANHRIQSYYDQNVLLTDLSTGDDGATLPATAVIASGHGGSNSSLNNELTNLQFNGKLNINIVAVGDCQAPRTALEAIFEGHEAARNL
ncbi:MAG: 2,4-dienoyl-CoA reductase-like NADH-dependent reductase (Old Yellow Enzyme family) [Granulosicoccus sp.]|jgi:2,4-dienoyl-CoA reductase-like NADH-dependent reductase (Old Yellow Enzyme family)/thioredoxin reductase